MDIKQPLYDLKRLPHKEGGEIVTVGSCIGFLVGVQGAPPSTPALERATRFDIAVRIALAEQAITLSEPETALVLRLIGESTLSPLFSEQLRLALEGKPNPLAPGNVVPMIKQA